MSADLRSIWFFANGVRLHAVEAGSIHGRPVLLLHGFPEFWYAWRHQIPALASAGFRVIALDQRGYNHSEKPPHISDYGVDALSLDIASVAQTLCSKEHPKVDVVAHDWGGGIAWACAVRFPALIRRMVILNAPHPFAMRKILAGNLQQMVASWYMLAFQIPFLPEKVFARDNHSALVHAMSNMALPGTFTPDDFAQYREAWSQPGALRSMINWYRALTHRPPKRLSSPRITMPTKILWGVRDTALTAQLAVRSAEYCDHPELEYFEDCTHWLQHEAPTRVNASILQFLQP